MTLRIDERIWEESRVRAHGEPEWVLRMLLTPNSSGSDDVVAAAVPDALAELEAAFTGDGEVPSAGDWEWMRVRDGVLLQVAECDDFAAALPTLARALERRGVEGTLSVWEEPVSVDPPRIAHLLACRVTVRGTRVHEAPRQYRWEPDPDRHAALLAAAEGWCRRVEGAPGLSLTCGSLGPTPIGAEPVTDRLAEAYAAGERSRLAAVGDAHFRAVAVRPHSGRLTLVAGVAPAALDELVELLREHADLLVYGSIRRGWGVYQALSEDTLPTDWPQRSAHYPRGRRYTTLAFDDLIAQDAFGVQLLGPGYTDRIPDSPSWRRESLGTATFLEHIDRDAWFAAPFVPVDDYSEPPAPALLDAARTELAPILHAPGTLTALGFADM
jgi:hypothetical protein